MAWLLFLVLVSELLQFAGSLPAAWADLGAFQSLTKLVLDSLPLVAFSLPPSWGSNSSFPALECMYLSSLTSDDSRHIDDSLSAGKLLLCLKCSCM